MKSPAVARAVRLSYTRSDDYRRTYKVGKICLAIASVFETHKGSLHATSRLSIKAAACAISYLQFWEVTFRLLRDCLLCWKESRHATPCLFCLSSSYATFVHVLVQHITTRRRVIQAKSKLQTYRNPTCLQKPTTTRPVANHRESSLRGSPKVCAR